MIAHAFGHLDYCGQNVPLELVPPYPYKNRGGKKLENLSH